VLLRSCRYAPRRSRRRNAHVAASAAAAAIASAAALAASVVIEQNDEWLVGRRYLSNHSLDAVLDQEKKDNNDREETRELTPA
jgi:hypothetical protein